MGGRSYLMASFCLLGLTLLGVCSMLGVMYYEPPYVGLHPAWASGGSIFGLALIMWASGEIEN